MRGDTKTPIARTPGKGIPPDEEGKKTNHLGSIPITVGTVAFVIPAIVMIAYYVFGTPTPSVTELVVAGIAAAAMSASGVSARYSAKSHDHTVTQARRQDRQAHNDRQEQLQLDRKQKAYDIACKWTFGDVKAARLTVRNAFDDCHCDGKKGDKEKLAILTDPETDMALSVVFGYFELAALASEHELADENVLFDQLRDAMDNCFKQANLWVLYKIEDQPDCYCMAIEMLERWRARMRKER